MARKAESLFDQSIRAKLTGCADSDYLLIDISTGDYEVDADEMLAAERLRERRPDALVWMRRVGSPFGRRLGGRRARSSK